ncbi:hypothetical protein, conserved [Leishmania tarentolae]|uniref:Uncharacterized protein n=1 Tax=Leishmania tarentolae TaxID=5689 RepID=A0A640KYD0_LEITA|nr:hypothetical protein, conserved [Leishmania tarentolae]
MGNEMLLLRHFVSLPLWKRSPHPNRNSAHCYPCLAHCMAHFPVHHCTLLSPSPYRCVLLPSSPSLRSLSLVCVCACVRVCCHTKRRLSKGSTRPEKTSSSSMLHPAIRSEHTIAKGVRASCLPLWIPHQLTALELGMTPVPHRVSTPCTLLRVHPCSACESIHAQDRCSDTAASVVVAEWSLCPEHVAAPASSDKDSLFLCNCGGGLCASAAASLSKVTCSTHWVVLRVCSLPPTSSAAGLQRSRSGVGTCQQWVERRLRLGTVLYASDWQFLVSQQEREAAAKENSSAIGVTDAKSEQTTTADMDALSTFFPAMHHGRYYATAQAFVQHCLHSDEHLVWCEQDPLLSVERTGVEDMHADEPAHHDAGSHTAKACSNIAVECTSVVAPENVDRWRSHVGVSRKRRRRWLSQHGRKCPSARAFQNAVWTSTHHQSTGDAALSCSLGTSVTALNSIYCAYLLKLKYLHECLPAGGEESLVTTASAAPAAIQEECSEPVKVPQHSLCTSSEYIEEALQSSSYARWYLALRPACRSALHIPDSGGTTAATVVVGGAEKAAAEEALGRALQEVFLHGITVSLALWFCTRTSSTLGSVDVSALQQRESSPTSFTASTGSATVLVAALLRDWWNQLNQEASELYCASATARPADRQRRWSRCYIAHQLWASFQTSDGTRSLRPAAAAELPPAPLAQLCAACAIVVVCVYRSQERTVCWNVSAPTVETGHSCAGKVAGHDASTGERSGRGDAADSSARAPSIDGALSNMKLTSASCRLPRMSEKESRRWCDDYRACMDLVLQLLFVEQQEHWAP